MLSEEICASTLQPKTQSGNNMGMGKRNLLICFDAFGTLYTPKRSVAIQYGEVARSLGFGGFSDQDLANSFKAAFKHEAKLNPNYGRATGMGAERWWTNIIHNTFKPYAAPSQPIPKDLAAMLIHRFNSSEGFSMYPDVVPLVHKLRADSGSVVVGVITNSDDRTPDILMSLGVRVNPRRFGEPGAAPLDSNYSNFDVDFTVMSYDVGHEKPDRRIFQAAETLLHETVRTASLDDWHKVYVGDEYAKDVVGALGAGWNAVLIDREAETPPEDVRWLDDIPPGSLFDVFAEVGAVGFSSLAKLAQWLPSRS